MCQFNLQVALPGEPQAYFTGWRDWKNRAVAFAFASMCVGFCCDCDSQFANQKFGRSGDCCGEEYISVEDGTHHGASQGSQQPPFS